MTTLDFALSDLKRREEEIARKDAALERAHREIGALQWEVADLRRQLEARRT